MARVFVSHRGVDSVPAERLAGDLRAAGQDVWLDEWEVRVGDSIIEAMNAGLASADFVVLCLSAAGVDAPWIRREWAPTVARWLEGQRVRVLPAVLSSGEVPAIIADLKVADLTTDWAGGVAALLAAIMR